jgi:magnesium transporter
MLPKTARELQTGLLLGLACGAVVGSVALLWLGNLGVAACLIGAIAGGVTVAALLGLAVPVLLHLVQRDPKVAAGPIALAGADMVTLLVYFNLARWLLG